MPKAKEPLEPKYEAGRAYLVPGALLNELIRGIRRGRPIAGVGLLSEEKDDGILLTATAQGGGSANCPFGNTYVSEGSVELRGGTVMGGEGTVTVDDETIGTVGSEPADGTHVWLEIGFTATVEDDVLLPGGDVTTATIGSGTTVPSNTVPTASSPTGTLYVDLGDWLNGAFRPAGCGNLQIFHCPGSLSYTRG
jgi:hypothetical protein